MNVDAEVVFWRGPAPFLFAPIPEEDSAAIKSAAADLSYGWGCIPVWVRIGESRWKTSLMPKDGRYLIPIKAKIQAEQNINVGSVIKAELDFLR